jgi:hypothetical protein
MKWRKSVLQIRTIAERIGIGRSEWEKEISALDQSKRFSTTGSFYKYLQPQTERVPTSSNKLIWAFAYLFEKRGAEHKSAENYFSEIRQPEGADRRGEVDAIQGGAFGESPGAAAHFTELPPLQRRTEFENEAASMAVLFTERNPKPLRIGNTSINNVFLMCGNHIEPLEVSIRYSPGPIKISKKIQPSLYNKLVDVAKANARKAGHPYFNGPNTRLLRLTEENTHQQSSGKEQRGITLELGPVSWEEYTVLNTFLDAAVFPDEVENTIRRKFANRALLYENSPDLRWCELANILVVAMIPITTDGFGLIQRRSWHGVSVTAGRLISGISENIHRYLDEAEPSNLGQNLNPIEVGSGLPIDDTYEPRGVPSPLLAAQRGLYEEVSTEIHRIIKSNQERFKFLNVVFDLEFFHPVLVGVIELGLQRDEVEKLIQEYPGKDHSENSTIIFASLNTADEETSRLLADLSRWDLAGLSAFVSSLKYWEARTNKQERA